MNFHYLVGARLFIEELQSTASASVPSSTGTLSSIAKNELWLFACDLQSIFLGLKLQILDPQSLLLASHTVMMGDTIALPG